MRGWSQQTAYRSPRSSGYCSSLKSLVIIKTSGMYHSANQLMVDCMPKGYLGYLICIMCFGFWVLGFGFWVLGFGFWVLGFGFWVLGSEFCRTKGLGFFPAQSPLYSGETICPLWVVNSSRIKSVRASGSPL